ncbi:MAG: hypothetical protein GX822_01410, partial [Alcaligenaceae bacterium]|nr:hypothetical protein [Alcaligenaceae bacterium]
SDTYRNILLCADKLSVSSISIPAISTGVHKYPKDFAAQVALETLSKELGRCEHVRSVLLVCSDMETANAYRAAAGGLALTSFQLVDLMPETLD